MNLIDDAWIPARRRSGRVERITPWQLADSFATDPFTQVAAPRPDFNGALAQLLIGLLQTCCAPEDGRQWRQLLRQPPTPNALRAAFLPVTSAFCLDGDGPRFMQDLTLADEIAQIDSTGQEDRTKAIGDILIDVPTGKTLRDNTDLFVKRGRVAALCPACAATALFTLQTNAPSGGQGHRTGIRGGGPLTTLVIADSLWETCWFGVLPRPTFLGATGNPGRPLLADQFPCLAPTSTSEDGQQMTPEDAHPAQVYWAMPRRIRLVFSETAAPCDLCSTPTAMPVRQYQTKNFGVNYAGPWRHPLSPYFIATDGTPHPVHPQPGGIGYRHWLGFVLGVPDGNTQRVPAAVVERYLQTDAEDLRLWAFGYDMDNMKARSWHDSTMPLLATPAAIREDFAFHVAALVRAAHLAALETRGQLKKALFKPKREVRGDLSFMTNRFWQETEPEFYAALPQVRQTLQDCGDVAAILAGWHRVLIRTSERIFDDVSQTGAFDAADPKRIALAWRDLQMALRGRKMRENLGLPDRAQDRERTETQKEG